MAHIDRVTKSSLRERPAFAAWPDTALDQLLSQGRVVSLSGRQKLSRDSSSAEENYCFLLEGIVAITLGGLGGGLRTPGLPAPANGETSQKEYAGYFESGDCFSDGFLTARGGEEDEVVDCVAVSHAVLLAVPASVLAQIVLALPAVRDELVSRIRAARSRFLANRDPAQRVVMDFFLREGYVTSSVVRVGRLDRCLDCNKCHDACAARHGTARMGRGGPTLGCLTFPVVCRTCVDKPCLAVCSFGGLVLDEASGDVRISERCGGCGACAEHCPNGAITMVEAPYTVADFPEPIPQSDPRGMTNVPDMFVAGDVSGAALIRLAINEAVRAIDAIAPSASPGEPNVLDVVIIGGGPAGVAAALRCEDKGLSYWVLEKDQLFSTIRDYPKNKQVMAEPHHVPLLGSLWFDGCTKEELLARWHAIVRDAGLRILEGAEVRGVGQQAGAFLVDYGKGQVMARHVVMCVGKRGAPRRLGVPGESSPRVRYILSDPDECAQKHVLVVGGGDSALEAALSLADVEGCQVTLSYRRDSFTRAKSLNRQRLAAYQGQGRLRVELKSTVTALLPRALRLKTEQGELTLENDFIFALLGAEPPTAFLEGAGIQVLTPGSDAMACYAATRGSRQRATKCDRCAGYADQACLAACPTGALIELSPMELFRQGRPAPRRDAPASATFAPAPRPSAAPAAGGDAPSPRLSERPFVTGVPKTFSGMTPASAWTMPLTVLAFVALAGLGVEAFLRRTQPEHSLSALVLSALGRPAEVSYSSGKGLGHVLGYVGMSAMLLSVVYSLRTRVKRFRAWGPQATWLSAHLWLGFLGAVLVTYHAAFKLDRWASIALFLMWFVILTGAFGRYVFGRTHSGVNLAEFELAAKRRHCAQWVARLPGVTAIQTLMGSDSSASRQRFLGVVLWHELRDRYLLLVLRLRARRLLADVSERRALLADLSAWAASCRRSSYYATAQRVLRHWNIVHIVLAIAMFVLAGLHVVYGFLYKAI